jgi:hypothetical protein
LSSIVVRSIFAQLVSGMTASMLQLNCTHSIYFYLSL